MHDDTPDCQGRDVQHTTVYMVVVVVSFFPRVQGFWETVRQFIPHLRFFFFLKWRLARAH